MEPSQNLYGLIEQSEGLRLTAYQDSKGVWTIGYGHTKGVFAGQTIDKTTAILLLQHDVDYAVNFVNQHCMPCTQGQFDALTDFVFNVGPLNLLQSTLLKYHLAKEYDKAAAEFPKWDHCNGQVLPGLVKRRLKEQALYSG